jgi:hypothetical protein
VNETIPCAFTGSGVAFDSLLNAVSADGAYHAVQVAPDRLQFARTFRPTWAIVLGVVAMPIALLGVVFLLIKTTETCLAVVEADHRGTRVRLAGKLSSTALGRVRMALTDGVTPAIQGAEVGRPVASAFEAAAPSASVPITSVSPAIAGPSAVPIAPPPLLPSVAPPAMPPASPPPLHAGVADPAARPEARVEHVGNTLVPSRPATPVAPVPLLILDDGQQAELMSHNLLGRDPVVADGEGAAQLVAVQDESRSVSKTHLAVTYANGAWHVVDRHSTNGVSLVGADGVERPVAVGEATEVPAGATVRFGARSFCIVAGSTS